MNYNEWYDDRNSIDFYISNWLSKNAATDSYVQYITKEIQKDKRNRTALKGMEIIPFQKTVRSITSALYNGWFHGRAAVAYNRSDRSKWWANKAKNKYVNLLGLNRNIFVAAVDSLVNIGLIEHKVGFKGLISGSLSKMIMNEQFEQVVRHFESDQLQYMVNKKEAYKLNINKKAQQIDHSQLDSLTLARLQDDKNFIYEYRKLLMKHHIYIPTKRGRYEWKWKHTNRKTILTYNDFYYPTRVYTNNFEQGGRIYSWFQSKIRSQDRKMITIDNQPTVELDYRSIHPSMLAYMGGERIDQEFYSVPGFDKTPFDRKLVKTGLLIMINATDRPNAIGGLQSEINKGNEESDIAMREYVKERDIKPYQIISSIEKKYNNNSVIGKNLMNDAGVKLQFTDGNIAKNVIKTFMYNNVPILGVHDSFIVPAQHQENLRITMINKFERELWQRAKRNLTEKEKDKLVTI